MSGIEQWIGGAAILGIVTAFWGKIKSIGWRITNLLIVKIRVEDDLTKAVSLYCWTHLKRSPFGEKRYSAFTEYVRPLDRFMAIAHELIGGDTTVFWKGWKPLMVSQFGGSNDKPLLNQFNGPSNDKPLILTFIRGTWNTDQLLIEATRLLNENRHQGRGKGKRFSIIRNAGTGSRRNQGVRGMNASDPTAYPSKSPEDSPINQGSRILGWKRDDIGSPLKEDPWGGLVFPSETDQLANRIRRWMDSEKWYRSRMIPWRFGCLLHGSPGTGKTSFVGALARELDLPVNTFDLASLSNGEMVDLWKQLMNQVPCIALLEDIDAVFKGRENRLGEEGGGLTFDCLLNCLGGIESTDGVLVFVTTNKLEDLDEALGRPDERGISTRPGRIDEAVEMLPLDDDCRRRLAERILKDCLEEIEQIIIEGDGDTGAQFQYRCSQIALSHYWSNSNGRLIHV